MSMYSFKVVGPKARSSGHVQVCAPDMTESSSRCVLSTCCSTTVGGRLLRTVALAGPDVIDDSESMSCVTDDNVLITESRDKHVANPSCAGCSVVADAI